MLGTSARRRPPWDAIFPCRLPMHCSELAELVMLLKQRSSSVSFRCLRPSQCPMLPGDAPCNSSFLISLEMDSSEASLLSLDHRGRMLRPADGCSFKMVATGQGLASQDFVRGYWVTSWRKEFYLCRLEGRWHGMTFPLCLFVTGCLQQTWTWEEVQGSAGVLLHCLHSG